mmetsp:Transcript_13939/g.30260  ORF Transcript_13939/g.30260 Transcript_13939/m.30260 type:complete len:235 (+) Transcript_13939:305-1009(+)
MSEAQRRQHFPGDYVVAGSGVASVNAGPQKHDAGAGRDVEGPAKKKTRNNDADDVAEREPTLTVVGLNYAEARAVFGDRVTLVREPENKYDSNAIRVLDAANRQIGHIQKEHAAPLSKKWDAINADLHPRGQHLAAEGKILDGGDGYKQNVRVSFRKMVARTRDWCPERTRKNLARNPYAAKKSRGNDVAVAATAGMTPPPKAGEGARAAPVTVSAKKTKGEGSCGASPVSLSI